MNIKKSTGGVAILSVILAAELTAGTGLAGNAHTSGAPEKEAYREVVFWETADTAAVQYDGDGNYLSCEEAVVLTDGLGKTEWFESTYDEEMRKEWLDSAVNDSAAIYWSPYSDLTDGKWICVPKQQEN